MCQHEEVLIIGGGVIGLSIAYFLAKEGVKVGIIDKGDLGREASWAGAGMLPAGNPLRAKSPMGQLRARGTYLFASFSEELLERTGLENGFHRSGGLELRLSEDSLERRRLEQVMREEQGEGSSYEVLDSAALRKLEPALSPALPGAIYYPEAAQIRNPRHLQALMAACASLRVKFFPGQPITAMAREGERITKVRSAQQDFEAEQYVVTAGAWSDTILGLTGNSAQVRPIRGQIVLLNSGGRAGSPLFRKLLLAGSQYMVPRPDGRILIGSTEEDSGFLKANTPSGVQNLLQFGVRVVPALAEVPIERMWSGLRPASPDGKPTLGRVPGTDNLFAATGHFRAGLQLSVITGILMKELLLGQPPSMNLEPFRVDRRYDQRLTANH